MWGVFFCAQGVGMLRGRGNVSEELSNLGKGEEKSRSCEKEGEICKGEMLAASMGE